MMNAIVTTTGSNALIPTSMESAMRLAEMMARGKLVPNHLQQSPGDCLMVVEQSMRWGMSPFAVAQCTSVIQGKLMFEGKLVAAALNSSGIMANRLTYDFSGAGADLAVKVTGTLKGETAPRDIILALRDAQTNNALWKKQPEQQLVYAGTRVWARRHAPEVMLGVYAPEEFEPQRDTFAGTTIEAEPIPQGQPRDTARAIGDELPDHALAGPPQPKRQTVAEWLDGLSAELAAAHDANAVDTIVSGAEVQKALDKLRNGALDRLKAMIAAAQARTTPMENAPEMATTDDDVFPGDRP